MATNNTLLDFLTQRADRQSTVQFQQVLADAKQDIPSPELQELFRTLFKGSGFKDVDKFYKDDKDEFKSMLPKSDGAKVGEWLRKTKDSKGGNLWNDFKQMFKGKDPLDMTPSDLDNLFKVYRDQGSKPVELKIQIDPSITEDNKNPAQIASLVAKFYNTNSAFFNSPKDLSYEAENRVLQFQGSDLKLKELLDFLKIKQAAQENILKQKKELTGTWYLPFTNKIKTEMKPGDEASAELPYFGDWANEPRYLTNGKPIFRNFQEAVDAQHADLIKEGLIEDGTYSWVNDKGQWVLRFEGSLSDIKALFSGITDDVTHMIQTIKNKASEYKRIGE